MARAILEHDIQHAFTIWYKGEQRRDGTWKVIPAKLPGVVAWHTPNGGERRDAFEGMRLKQSGVEAGIHDYLFLWGGLYGIEFKRPGQYRCPSDGLSSAQRIMHPLLLAAGMIASATVDSLEAAKGQVRAWGLVRIGG